MSTTWSTKEWLKGFGLEQYYNCFIENGYETSKLCANLKNEDLDGMDIKNSSHRNIFLTQSEMLKTTLDTSIGAESPGKSGHNSPAGRRSIGGQSPKKRNSSSSVTLPLSAASTISGEKMTVITDTDTYTTVFDDTESTKVKKRGVFSRSPKQPKSDIDKKAIKKGSAGRFMSTTSQPVSGQSVLASVPPKLMTKLQLKFRIKEMLARDQIVLSSGQYVIEDGTPNELALIQLAESYADELKLEGLNVYDALKDVWRYVANDKSEYVLPKSNSSTPSTASSAGGFLYPEDNTYSEPFDSTVKASGKTSSQKASGDSSSRVHISVIDTASTSTSLSSNYADPFDAIPVTNQPVIVKTSPVVNKAKFSQPSSTLSTNNPTVKPSNGKYSKGTETRSSKTLPPPGSPNLSTHSSSSDDGAFVQSERFYQGRKGMPLPGLSEKKKLTSSMEDLHKNETKRLSRQSLPPNEFNLPRSISTNPSLLYQQSVDLEKKKNISGSLGSLDKLQSNLPILLLQQEKSEESNQAAKVTSRIKGLTVAASQQSKSELELSNMLEVYIEGTDKPIKFHKAKDINELTVVESKDEKKKSSLLRRLFHKKKGKNKITSVEETTSEEADEQKSGLTNSTSLPDITAVASVHSEYAEIFDVLPVNNNDQLSPPKLPSRNRPQSAKTIGTSSPTITHQSNKVIHASPVQRKDDNDIIEISTHTNDSLPKTNRHGVLVCDSKLIQGQQELSVEEIMITPLDQLYEEPQFVKHLSSEDSVEKEVPEEEITQDIPNKYEDPWKPIMTPKSRSRKTKSSENSEEISTRPVTRSVTPPSQSSSPSLSVNASPSHLSLDNRTKPVPPKPSRKSRSKSKTPEEKDLSSQPPPEYQDIDDVYARMHKINSSDSTLERDSGINSNGSQFSKTPKKVTASKPVSLSSNLLQIALEKKVADEFIDLTAQPYSSQRGEYGIPSALVSRYSEETGNNEEEVAKMLDKIRRASLLKCRRGHIPFKKDWKKFSEIKTTNIETLLVSIGLSHHHDLIVELGLTSVSLLKECDLNLLPFEYAEKKSLIDAMEKL